MKELKHRSIIICSHLFMEAKADIKELSDVMFVGGDRQREVG